MKLPCRWLIVFAAAGQAWYCIKCSWNEESVAVKRELSKALMRSASCLIWDQFTLLYKMCTLGEKVHCNVKTNLLQHRGRKLSVFHNTDALCIMYEYYAMYYVWLEPDWYALSGADTDWQRFQNKNRVRYKHFGWYDNLSNICDKAFQQRQNILETDSEFLLS